MEFKSFSLTHKDHQVSRGLLNKALKMIDSDEKSGQHVVDFGRIVGFSDLVEVNDDDEFFLMVRGDRPYMSRFVKNRLPIECSKLVVIWKRTGDHIKVITAYFTDRDEASCPDEPANILRKMEKGIRYSQSQIKEAYEFWSKHAFVEPIPWQFLH